MTEYVARLLTEQLAASAGAAETTPDTPTIPPATSAAEPNNAAIRFLMGDPLLWGRLVKTSLASFSRSSANCQSPTDDGKCFCVVRAAFTPVQRTREVNQKVSTCFGPPPYRRSYSRFSFPSERGSDPTPTSSTPIVVPARSFTFFCIRRSAVSAS